MKVQTSVLIDIELKKKAEQMHIKFGQTLEDALRQKIAFANHDIDGINAEKMKVERQILVKKVQKNNQKLAEIDQILGKIEQKQLENEKKRLENEQKLVEKTKKCSKCGIIMNDEQEIKKVDDKILCKNCFMAY